MFTKKDLEMAARMVRILATTGDSAGATLVIRLVAGTTLAVSEPAKRMKRAETTADTRKLQSESAKAVWAKRKAEQVPDELPSRFEAAAAQTRANVKRMLEEGRDRATAKSEAQKAASAAAKAAIAKRWDRVRLEAKQVA